ncbi:PQQ-dependent sugar dehydrogenase [Pedobacter panaciterrae]
MKLNNLLILFAAFVIASCSQTREVTNILYFSKNINDKYVAQLKESGKKNGWDILVTSDASYLSEDSLKRFKSVAVSFSTLNGLDHQSLPEIKRYLESGGGGVVAIRDTTLETKGWPWLNSLVTQKSREELSAGDRVLVIDQDADAASLTKAFQYTIGSKQNADYTKVNTLAVPDSSRYTRIVLAEGLDEPMEMALLPNLNVLFIERKGGVKLYNNETKEVKTIANIGVFSGIEDGLLGVVLDPKFEENHWVYFYYAVPGEEAVSRLSRFQLLGETLNMKSEQVLLRIPTQRKYCCHSAGYLAFDAKGLLYLSTGDNTNAEETEGYTPVDERPGRELADDQATSANTNDLRGKILRIQPEEDGTYSIPDGNLFPKDGSAGLPEIYTMGSRNPYRFSIDHKNGYVYWGDVGPDTKVVGEGGEFMSYDEINQAKGPGFFGWPYFLGNSQAFPMYDYATKKLGERKDPAKPLNNSPNNTGEKELPPAQKAMIWYGKIPSKNFPLAGSGGATAAAGPVYYSDLFPNAPYKLSEYYNGKLFIYEWIRGWIMAVTFDEQGNYLRMEPFLKHLKFSAPVDMQFSADGAIYMLEYGTNWFSKNTDAKLVRIEYQEGNRKPVAEITIDKPYGGAPHTVELSASKSVDYDKADRLSYRWEIDGKIIDGVNTKYTFDKAGIYNVELSVKDDKGAVGIAKTKVHVGNTPPEVTIQTAINRSFYWDNQILDYNVIVEDAEDQNIDQQKVNVTFGYIPQGKDVAVILAGNQDPGAYRYLRGAQMLSSLDCKACHSMDKESVGPTYQAISARYNGKKDAVRTLSHKVIEGGSGSWGERAMSAHPALSSVDAAEMVSYILSLSERPKKLPLKNTIPLKDHIGKGIEGSYLLNATYRDLGANGIEPLDGRAHISLRNPFVQADDFDKGNVRIITITTEFMAYVTGLANQSYINFKDIDLTGVKRLKYRVQLSGTGGNIELRLDSKEGPVVSTVAVPAGNAVDVKLGWKEIEAAVSATTGKHNLYFVFVAPSASQNMFNLDWIYFSNK